MHSSNPSTLASAQLSLLKRSDMTAAPAVASVCVQSADLLKGQKTLAIEHNGAVYRLQATKLGKLILTK